jgi:hypothetical protein
VTAALDDVPTGGGVVLAVLLVPLQAEITATETAMPPNNATRGAGSRIKRRVIVRALLSENADLWDRQEWPECRRVFRVTRCGRRVTVRTEFGRRSA